MVGGKGSITVVLREVIFVQGAIPPHVRHSPIYLFNFRSSWPAERYHTLNNEQERVRQHRNSAYMIVWNVEEQYEVYLRGGISQLNEGSRIIYLTVYRKMQEAG